MTPVSTGEALDRLADRLAAEGVEVRRDAPLGALTTYRVGGTASLVVEARSEGDLLSVQAAMTSSNGAAAIEVLVLGKGSNLLVSDEGFHGMVVRPGGDLASISIGEGGVRAGGAAGLPVVARRSVEAGLTGLEWAVGIPGSVGGALKMNAGGHGSDTASCLLRYRWIDLAGRELGLGESGPEQLRLGYRTSSLGGSEVVISAVLAARPGDAERGRATLSEIVHWRREHQPGGSNAGSVFTNPPGGSAGRLVEQVGLKGYRLGTAMVSDKHANFIQADDGGSAEDVLSLMDHVRGAVARATGELLRPEVKLVGFGHRFSWMAER